MLWGKRVVVFVLWTISMVFFRVGSGNLSGMAENLGVGDAFVYLGRCLMNSLVPRSLCRGAVQHSVYRLLRQYHYGSGLLGVRCVGAGAWHLAGSPAQFACKNKPAEVALASAKHRNALYVVLIVFILVGYIMQSGGFNANAFGPMQGFNLTEKRRFPA